MTASATARLRRLWLKIHLWIGVGLCLLLVPIGLSGSLLVWHDHVDALINPSRYAVTQGEALPTSALLSAATQAAGAGFQPLVVRLPEAAGWPATVSMRQQRSEQQQGGRPQILTVSLDPATGRVLDVANMRSSLIGFLHRFHENLTIPSTAGVRSSAGPASAC